MTVQIRIIGTTRQSWSLSYRMTGHRFLLHGSYTRLRLVPLPIRSRVGHAHPFLHAFLSPSPHSQDHHHEYLIRTSLRFDILESALEHTLSLVRKVSQAFPLFRHIQAQKKTTTKSLMILVFPLSQTGGCCALTRTTENVLRDLAPLYAHRPGTPRGGRTGRLGGPWTGAPTDAPDGD